MMLHFFATFSLFKNIAVAFFLPFRPPPEPPRQQSRS